jgi:formylglycine-generating enzyme required for sulfatase activity
VQEMSAGRLPNGYCYRLPSELEWQYCGQAGIKNSINHSMERFAWYSGNSMGVTHDIGQRPSSYFGLHDLFGNIAEWCLDSENQAIEQSLIKQSKDHYFKALRGGSWYHDLSACSPEYQQYYDPAIHDFFIGFRIVLAPNLED